MDYITMARLINDIIDATPNPTQEQIDAWAALCMEFARTECDTTTRTEFLDRVRLPD